MPPLAASEVVEYADPTCPFGRPVVVIFTSEGEGGAAATLMVKSLESVNAIGEVESFTWKVTGKFPLALGVPDSCPPSESNTPLGSVPASTDQW